MDFKKLKEEIKQAKNKKDNNNIGFIRISENTIKIRSSLYLNDIDCNNIESASDIYNVVNEYQLDPELFSQPFYIIASLGKFDEKIINIINQLDNNIHIQINIDVDVDEKAVEMLSKIEHKNCHLYLHRRIYLSAVEQFLSKITLEEESRLCIVVDYVKPQVPGHVL